MKQMETTEKKIGESTFYIRPFPAFTAANISGELAAVIAPLLASIAPLFGRDADQEADIMDMDIDKAMPSISNAFSSLSGEKFESLMKKLLINSGNISVMNDEVTEGETQRLTYDLANEVFCGEVQDMYILCFEVIRLNYKGFFKKLGGRFGNLQGLITKLAPSSANTESST